MFRPPRVFAANAQRQSTLQRKTDIEQDWKDDFIEVDRTRVHYIRAGAGTPLFLIHGLTGSTLNWRKNVDALACTASVYVLDLVNMGRSDRVLGIDASLAATADRIAECMSALGIDRADIAGHSHGGAIVMMLAARHPRRVHSLILFAPANPYSRTGDFLIRLYSSAVGGIIARMAPYLPRWVQLIALRRMYGVPARIVDGTLDGYVLGLRIRGTIHHVISILRGWSTDMASLEQALPTIAHIPTLLVWGDRDRAVSLASGRRLHQEFPNSEFLVLSTGGHVVFEEMPEQSNRVMLAWLVRQHGGTAPAAIRV